jgi:hypothetical protein
MMSPQLFFQKQTQTRQRCRSSCRESCKVQLQTSLEGFHICMGPWCVGVG